MKIKIFFLAGAILFFANVNAKTPAEEDGKIIFTTQCAACHNVNVKVVGPALANVDQRRSIDWIVKFIHSSQTLIKGNDLQAVALFNEFNQTIMPDHSDLSAEQIKSIVAYVKSQTKAIVKDDAPFSRPGKLEPKYLPVSITNIAFFGSYIAVILIMIGCFVIAVKIKEMQRENNKVDVINGGDL